MNTGTLLVGRDGSRSTVRSLLFPEQNGNVHDNLTILNFPAAYVMYLLCILDNPNPDKPQTWKYQNLLSWKGPPYPRDLTDPADRIARLKELGKDFAEPWRSAALGQGLNHGLQDAKDLVDALTSEQSLEQAVGVYEKGMVARAGMEVEVSGKQAAMAHDWDSLMQSPMFKLGANKSV